MLPPVIIAPEPAPVRAMQLTPSALAVGLAAANHLGAGGAGGLAGIFWGGDVVGNIAVISVRLGAKSPRQTCPFAYAGWIVASSRSR